MIRVAWLSDLYPYPKLWPWAHNKLSTLEPSMSRTLYLLSLKGPSRMEFRGRNFLTQENCLLTVPLPSLSHYLMQRKYPGLQNFFLLSMGPIGSNALPHPFLLIRCSKKGLAICHMQRSTSVMPILPLVEMSECFFHYPPGIIQTARLLGFCCNSFSL